MIRLSPTAQPCFRSSNSPLALVTLFLFSAFLIPAGAVASTQDDTRSTRDFARGVVFVDSNGNGLREEGEKPMAGVRVSNGIKIVKTDADGKYSLPVADDTIIFVIKPSGYRTPLSKNNLPRFYYIHKPQGSPKLKYKGVEPTGPLPASIDFPLYPQDEPTTFKAIMFGDPQPRNQKELDYIAKDVLAELVGTDASLGVTLGDIMFDDLSLFKNNNRAVALLGIPWYNVIGNHDINFDAKNRKHANESFERTFGPSYYSFDYGSTHFVVLDNINWTYMEDRKRFGYRGGFGEEQLEFLRSDLAMIPKNQFVCLMMHIPIVGVADRSEVYKLIKDRPLTISISGHTHHHEHLFLGKKDGFEGKQPHHHIINVTVSGSWWSGKKDERGIPHTTMADGAPNGYSILTFDGQKYQIDFKAAGKPKTHQMGITLEAAIPLAKLKETPFFVNVFNGSEKSRVEMSVNDGKRWVSLKKVIRNDPNFERLHAEDQAIQNRTTPKLTGPRLCPHLWEGTWNGFDLKPGTHLLSIRATDVNGKLHTAQRVFRITE